MVSDVWFCTKHPETWYAVWLLQDLTSLDGGYEEEGMGTDDSSSTGEGTWCCLHSVPAHVSCIRAEFWWMGDINVDDLQPLHPQHKPHA